MKPVAFALLFFLPVAAGAQDQSSRQRRSSGKKMVWVGVGSLAGGAALAVFGAMSGKETVTRYTGTAANPNCVTTGTGSVSATACTVATIVAVTVPVVTATGGTLVPSNPPGGGTSSTPLPAPGNTSIIPVVATSSFTTSTERCAANWKIIGPAIGVAGAGAFLTHLGRVRVKKAELSVRPSGALQLAFKW